MDRTPSRDYSRGRDPPHRDSQYRDQRDQRDQRDYRDRDMRDRDNRDNRDYEDSSRKRNYDQYSSYQSSTPSRSYSSYDHSRPPPPPSDDRRPPPPPPETPSRSYSSSSSSQQPLPPFPSTPLSLSRTPSAQPSTPLMRTQTPLNASDSFSNVSTPLSSQSSIGSVTRDPSRPDFSRSYRSVSVSPLPQRASSILAKPIHPVTDRPNHRLLAAAEDAEKQLALIGLQRQHYQAKLNLLEADVRKVELQRRIAAAKVAESNLLAASLREAFLQLQNTGTL